ncbi:RagB/SusD family nutrient uptake outer membrane protein [Pedobacter sp. SD-b]|uniref:RagB/SusD family nutrient uptake outer membrane protein n=1 Tax=Pedobacter segetis TaxID=2793069 RepID=A0ABS1BGW1_9SPHI|nr:RagB/SusD family nutrient uptake outer membrane protein [Pedobacter segetis]MBK0382095.1 RagB/SusD family nutrient uptake outer membrane protein [Pedobacter segetis]
MKTKHIFTSIFFVMIGLSACKKEKTYLDPTNNYSYYNFPENEDQVNQAVVAIYTQARSLYNADLWQFGEFRSDNTSFRYNPNDRGGLNTEQLDEFTALSDNGSINAMWADSYNGIAKANYALQNLDAITFRDPAVKTQRQSEAKFWRAWFYFNLVRLYGDVPLVTKVVISPSEGPTYQREATSKIYSDLIIPDAMAAVSGLPPTIGTSDKGRLSKGAGLMLLAEVYMTLKRFDDANTTLQQLTTLGYSLDANYADNFDPTKKNGPESILEMQSDATQGITFGFYGAWTPYATGANIYPGGSNSRGGLNQPTKDLINSYETGDKRKAVTVGTYNNIDYLKKFLYWDASTRANPVNFVTYRYADALLMYAESLNEISFPNAQAFSMLNQVRTRAGLPNKTQANIIPALAINSQADFRLAIEKERRVELAGENHRWFDLLRTGRAVAVMTAHGAQEKALKPTTIGSGAYDNIRTLLAIPFRQAQQYGYAQNPGWE